MNGIQKTEILGEERTALGIPRIALYPLMLVNILCYAAWRILDIEIPYYLLCVVSLSYIVLMSIEISLARKQGKIEIILRVIAKNNINVSIRNQIRIKKLKNTQLDRLADCLPQLQNAEELNCWLNQENKRNALRK